MLIGFPTHHVFSQRPTYRALAARLSLDELLAELAKPAVQAQILGEEDVAPDPTVLFDGFFQLMQGRSTASTSLGDPPGVRAHPRDAPSRRWPRLRASTRWRSSTT